MKLLLIGFDLAGLSVSLLALIHIVTLKLGQSYWIRLAMIPPFFDPSVSEIFFKHNVGASLITIFVGNPHVSTQCSLAHRDLHLLLYGLKPMV